MISNRHVAVWIDHDEARIFHVDAASFDKKTLRAPAHRIHRHPQGAPVQQEQPEDAHRFFRAVAHELEGAERVLVVGPSTAKLQFIHYAYKHDASLEPRIVGVETVDQPTDPQLVARSRPYFAAFHPLKSRLPAGTRH